MSAHTPGPWSYETGDPYHHGKDASEDGFFIRLGKGRLTREEIRYCDGIYPEDGEDHEVAEANARLIAAAPDLLAALNVLLGSYVDLANCGDCGSWDPEEEPMVIAARAAIAKATTP